MLVFKLKYKTFIAKNTRRYIHFKRYLTGKIGRCSWMLITKSYVSIHTHTRDLFSDCECFCISSFWHWHLLLLSSLFLRTYLKCENIHYGHDLWWILTFNNTSFHMNWEYMLSAVVELWTCIVTKYCVHFQIEFQLNNIIFAYFVYTKNSGRKNKELTKPKQTIKNVIVFY